MSENKTKQCNKCLLVQNVCEYRYRRDKNWYNVICKQCERNDNKILREQRKINSLIPVSGKKLCLRCNAYKNNDQFMSLDKFRPQDCNSCIDCRKKDQKYYNSNKTIVNNRNNNYYQENKTEIRKKRKFLFIKYKEKYLAKQRARYNSDIEFKIAQSLRRRLRKCIGSGSIYDQLISCSSSFLLEWLNYNLQFSKTMNWQNYGSYWHLDHVIPCKHFNLTDTKQQKICFNWRNISPLEQTLNQSKMHRVDLQQLNTHNQRLIDFSKLKNIEVLIFDPKQILAQPQIPLYNGNIIGKQMDESPLDGNNSEDDDSDYDSDIDDLIIDETEIQNSEMGNPQLVLPVTSFNINSVVLQLDSIKLC